MAISCDPETDFLIKEGLRQKREVELGRMKLDEATALPKGSRLEGGRVVMPGDAFFNGLGLLIFVPLVATFVFWIFSILIEYALSEYAKPTTTFYIIVPVIALILGIAFHWIRDHLNLPAYAVVEIGGGMATAAQFARPGDALVRALAFLAGVRIIVDGTGRFLKFTGFLRERATK